MKINAKNPLYALLGGLLFTSCLKETVVPIASSFELTIGEDKVYSPGKVDRITNILGVVGDLLWFKTDFARRRYIEESICQKMIRFDEGKRATRLMLWMEREAKMAPMVGMVLLLMICGRKTSLRSVVLP